MLGTAQDRINIVRQIISRANMRWVALAWLLICTYDTVGGQLVPKWIADRLPTLYDGVEMTSGWLPWWAWGWIGTAILCAAAVEYATRLHLLTAPSGVRLRTVAHLRIRYPNLERSIVGSDNIKHMITTPDGVVVVEFKTPVQPRGLTARRVQDGAVIGLSEVGRLRAKLDIPPPEESGDILFESPEGA